MKKSINSNPKKAVSKTVYFSLEKPFLSECEKRKVGELSDSVRFNDYIFMTLNTPVDVKKKKKKEVVVAPLTAKQEKEKIKNVRAGYEALLLLPTPPFVTITPAPGFGNKNAADICTYVNQRLPNVVAVPAFDTCSPSPLDCQVLYTALLPLSGIGRKISTADLTNRTTLETQLKQAFTGMSWSCALLSNGNAALFALLEIATKKKAVRNNTKLVAPVVTLSVTHGTGVIGVGCVKIPFAINYSIAFGVGDDESTYTIKTGAAKQLLNDLPLGVKLTIIMWANSAIGAGFKSNPQSINVPFN